MTNSSGVVLREDVFTCLSRNGETFRLVLTKTHLLLHNSKDHSRMSRYAVEDIFGCHTLRHKKQDASYTSAYICFYLYPRNKKKGLMSNIKYREKCVLVFEVKKSGNSFDKNLDIATLWKNETLGVLASKYPKWQLQESGSSNPNNNDGTKMVSTAISKDIMDHSTRTGEPKLPLASYLSFLRRFLVILNPKSGQGKTMEMFQVWLILLRGWLLLVSRFLRVSD